MVYIGFLDCDLDERTSRTPRNLNETKRSGRTNKKIEHWISFKDLIEKALIFSGAENFDDKICWEDFEAPEWCVPIKANVLTFEWDLLIELKLLIIIHFKNIPH
uniref:Uncharacterized protein n=1 Tax=Rhizophagus irregularis (strain DAOM 181602 / DAOM 197198 / MUCL 43194) TaxID=747089 RepID=U9TMH3_RHIID